MNEFKVLIRKTTEFLIKKTKNIVVNNKKKIIALVIFIIAAYVIKKKMTMAHFLAIIDAFTKLIQMLPLPDSPKLRQLSKYEHPNSSPLKSIFQAMKVDEIKKQISLKEASWQDLKQSIIIGAILTISLYNINSFYFLVQNKYLEDFKELEALSQFDQAMYCLRKKFIDQIPLIFTNFKEILRIQLDKLQLQKIYTHQELDQIFQKLSNRIFQSTFNAAKEYKKSIIKKKDPKSVNYFTSPYQYIPKKKSIIQSVGLGVLNILGGCIRVFDWFPEAKQEITSHRYNIIKKSYILSVDKTDFQNIKWPNQTSKNLFNLVLQEITFSFSSLNFSVLMKEHTKYNKKILMNRINLWLIANKTNEVKLLKFLPTLYKILKEEFFKTDLKEYRQNYHEKQLRKNIRQITLEQKDQQVKEEQGDEPISLQEHILEEIQLSKCFQYLQREFQLRFFHERSGYVHRIRKNDQGKDPKQMQKLLSMISGNEVLNQNQ